MVSLNPLLGLACVAAFAVGAYAVGRAWPGRLSETSARLLAGLGAGVGLAAAVSV